MKKCAESSTGPLVEAPPEPKQLYPEPVPDATEVLALIQGSTFFAANRHGDLMPPSAPQIGLFYEDTRFLSQLELLVNSQTPLVLSSTIVDADSSRVELTVRGRPVTDDSLDIPVNTVYVHRYQLLGNDTFYETLEIQNFHNAEVTLTVELRFAADFMDIFQVRGL
ncbi:MAG: glycogen debranching N-terminal domain-containing protein, partial [Acidobacteriaceae bacterium]